MDTPIILPDAAVSPHPLDLPASAAPQQIAPRIMCGACLGRGTPFVVPMGQCRFCDGTGISEWTPRP